MRPLRDKNFSTAALAATLGMLGLVTAGQGGNVYAQASPPVAQTMSPPAQGVRSDPFVASAPTRYTVVRGDTLWGIAKRFLKNPLEWPHIWRMNRDQIKNPHWIYPVQVIVIDRLNGTMYLEGRGADGSVIRVEPEVRVETSEHAIPSIPQDVIQPFLSQPLVVETETMHSAPRIVGSKNDQVVLARGDYAYVSGITDPSITSWQVYRPGTALKDPDTNSIIAYQAEYLGAAQLIRSGDPATMLITSFAQEMEPGDRLVPSAAPVLVNYVPHAPASPIKGKVITTLGGIGYAGRDAIVVLNRGSADGLEMGNVLAVQTAGRTVTDTTNGSREEIKLPDERNGLVFVFRVFDHITYALVLDADIEVQRGDVVQQP